MILIADVFRISLINGLPCREDMILWAENELKNSTEESGWLAELSISGSSNVNDLITLLDQKVGYTKPLISARIVMGNLFRHLEAGSLQVEKVTRVLDWLARHSPLSTEEKYIITGIDDKLQLAKNKTFGDVKDVEMEVRRFLKLFHEFSRDSEDQWEIASTNIIMPLRALFDLVRKEQAEYIEKQQSSGWKSLWGLWK